MEVIAGRAGIWRTESHDLLAKALEGISLLFLFDRQLFVAGIGGRNEVLE